MTLYTIDEKRQAKREKARRNAKRHYLRHFKDFAPGKNYIFGTHTYAIIAELQTICEKLERGESSFTILNEPYRHGKTDKVGVAFPPWAMVRNPDWEFIIGSYNQKLAAKISYKARERFMRYGGQYGLAIASDKSAVNEWKLQDHKGAIYAAGLQGGIAGQGGDVIIIDDPYKNREEAESELIRNKVWDGFRNDLMTRRPPACAVIIVMHRWHEDDLCGRIIRLNDPDGGEYDAKFPKFNILKFPAQNPDGTWLFPERFSNQWYEESKALLGSYAWNSLGLQDPKPRTGKLLRGDLCKIIKPEQLPKELLWRRGWDIASTEKERIKDDPDYSAGVLEAYDKKTNSIFIRDVQRGQWSTLHRNARITAAAKVDGANVRVRIESVAGYVDAYNTIKAALQGIAIVEKVTPGIEKVARATYFEPIFEAGNVFLLEGEWNKQFISEINAFPGGKHDDVVDGMIVGIHSDVAKVGKGLTSQVY